MYDVLVLGTTKADAELFSKQFLDADGILNICCIGIRSIRVSDGITAKVPIMTGSLMAQTKGKYLSKIKEFFSTIQAPFNKS